MKLYGRLCHQEYLGKPDYAVASANQWVRIAGSSALIFAQFGELEKAAISPCTPPPLSVKYGL